MIKDHLLNDLIIWTNASPFYYLTLLQVAASEALAAGLCYSLW